MTQAATMTEQVLMLAERLKRWASQFATSNTAMAYDLREAAATLQGSAALPSEAITIYSKGPNDPAMMLCSKLADIGCVVEIETMREAMQRAATPTAPVQDDDAELVEIIAAAVREALPEATAVPDAINEYPIARKVERRIFSRLSPTPDTDQQQGASPLATGLSQAEPTVSALRASIPSAVSEAVLSMGKVDWGAVGPKPDAEHVTDFADSLALTRENFKTKGPRYLAGVYLTGTETVLCHTGTSPNSPNNARAIAGIWNWLVDLCASAGEAGTAETENTGSVHEHAVGAAETPNPGSDTGLIEADVERVALALGVALKADCISHDGTCYAVVDSKVAYDGDIAAEVDGEFSLMALASAAITALANAAPAQGEREMIDYDPGRCLIAPHVWSAWSPWTPLMTRVPATVPVVDAVPKPEPIRAYRERLCRRCGVEEQENYQGKRKVMRDPRGIAKRIGASASRPNQATKGDGQ